MNKFKKNDGFTSVELVTVIAILAAVAYIVLPLLFPSDAKTSKQYIEEDLNNISQILQIRTQTSEVNGIPINEMYIGNLGVYASRAQVKHAIKINPQDKTLLYCLRGEYRGEVLYLESNGGVFATPSGSMDCPGVPAQSNPVEEAPAEEQGNTQDPADTSPENSNSGQNNPDTQTQTVSDIITPGAFCAAGDEGKFGIASNGDTYVCALSNDDTRLRWRINE